LRDSGLQGWVAQAEFSEVSGIGWRGEDVYLRAKHSVKGVQLDAQVKSLQVDQRWRFASQLSRVEPQFTDAIRWRSGTANLLIERTGGQLQSLSVTQEGGSQQWRGRGSWVRDGDFAAVLRVFSANRERAYSIRGNPSDFVVDGDVGALSR